MLVLCIHAIKTPTAPIQIMGLTSAHVASVSMVMLSIIAQISTSVTHLQCVVQTRYVPTPRDHSCVLANLGSLGTALECARIVMSVRLIRATSMRIARTRKDRTCVSAFKVSQEMDISARVSGILP